VADLRKFVEASGFCITYFEMITAVMFRYFIDRNVEIAVIEVGLGGRLDSTNVCFPIATVLTIVEKEHTEVLGKTYHEILNEKLGIVKKGIPLFVGHQSAFVKKEIFSRKFPSSVFYVNEKSNMDLAKECLIWVSKNVLKRSFDFMIFNRCASELKIIGRFQVENVNGRDVVFDMAHTAMSAKMLRNRLEDFFGDKKFVFLISMMKHKNVSGFLKNLVHVGDKVVFSESHPVRSRKISELREIFPNSEAVKDPLFAFNKTLKIKKNDPLVVTGSHFIVGEILKQLSL